MKKILITLLFALGFATAVAFPRVSALDDVSRSDLGYLWELNSDTNPTGFILTIGWQVGAYSTMDIIIPSWIGGIGGTFNVTGDYRLGVGAILDDADLADWVSFATDEVITFDFNAGTISTLSAINDLTDGDLRFTTYIEIYVNTVDYGDLSDYEEVLEWLRQEQLWVTSAIILVVLIDRGVTIDVMTLDEVALTWLPTVTPPTGYNFAGWRNRFGELLNQYDFKGLSVDNLQVSEEYGTYLPLFSFFTIASTSTEDVPDPDPETVAAFIRIPLSEIGLDSEVGYFLIYVIVCVLLVLGIVALAHLAWSFVLMAIFIWTVGATWLGIIPFWATAIIGIFCIGFLFKSISGSSEGSMEP